MIFSCAILYLILSSPIFVNINWFLFESIYESDLYNSVYISDTPPVVYPFDEHYYEELEGVYIGKHFIIIEFSSIDKNKHDDFYTIQSMNHNKYSPLHLPLPASDKMNSLIMLYLDTFYCILIIFIIVFFLLIEFVILNHQSVYHFDLYYFMYRLNINKKHPKVKEKEYTCSEYKRSYTMSTEEEHMIDIFVIIFPTIIILELMIPSLGYLYNEEAIFYNTYISFDVNIIGNQWFWTYEYVLELGITDSITQWHSTYTPNDKNQLIFSFDSILVTDNSNNRLLDVDRRLVLPVHTNILFSFTSRDVIHSWALPQMGIKVDCVPGLITHTLFCSYSEGVFYGQCSELCGILHGFMPICVEVVSYDNFFLWFLYNYNDYCASLNIKGFSYYEEVLKLLGEDKDIVLEKLSKHSLKKDNDINE